jgi:hypothetical protein
MINRNKLLPFKFESDEEMHYLNLECLRCKRGTISVKKLHFEETKSSKGLSELLNHPPEYLFTAVLQCDYCEVRFFTIGDGFGYWYDPNTDEKHLKKDDKGEYEKWTRFQPRYVHPPIYLFEINDKCPQKIKNAIVKAFEVYFADVAACANRIRVAIELIMHEQKVRKVYKPAGANKEQKYTLHKRIELFENKKSDIAKHIMAIKWISNKGSHAGNLTANDVLTGFELLEYCIEQLYDNKVDRLNKIAERINKKKKP